MFPQELDHREWYVGVRSATDACERCKKCKFRKSHSHQQGTYEIINKTGGNSQGKLEKNRSGSTLRFRIRKEGEGEKGGRILSQRSVKLRLD